MKGAALLGILAGAQMAQAQIDEGWQPVLDCRFEVECGDADATCDRRDIWYVVRHHSDSGQFRLFDVTNQTARDVRLTKHAHLLVFDRAEDQDTPKASSSSDRLIVASDGSASFQYAFYVAFEEDDWRFFSGEHVGQCLEIKQ